MKAHIKQRVAATREHRIWRHKALSLWHGRFWEEENQAAPHAGEKEKVKNRRRRVTRRPNMGWVSFIYYMYIYTIAAEIVTLAAFSSDAGIFFYLPAASLLIGRTQSFDFYKKMPLFGSNKTGIWELIWTQSCCRRSHGPTRFFNLRTNAPGLFLTQEHSCHAHFSTHSDKEIPLK